MQEFRTYWRIPSIIFVFIVVFDTNLGPVEGTSIEILAPWLYLTYVKNTGVAFGLFQGVPHFFTIVNIIISAVALYVYRYQMSKTLLTQICIGGIIGGAIGNIIDRIRQGFVTDFVHVTWFPGIFNVADSAITVCVIVLALESIRNDTQSDAT
jgi:signal peptidase II